MSTGQEGNTEFEPFELCIKIDLVSHPLQVEGFSKYTYGKGMNPTIHPPDKGK